MTNISHTRPIFITDSFSRSGGGSGEGETRGSRPRRALLRQRATPLHRLYRSGSRLSVGASPWSSTPSGGSDPSHACRRCGASSTRVAANAFCAATESIPHHRFSHANAVERRRRGGADWLFSFAKSRRSWQVVSLQRPPTSPARMRNLHVSDLASLRFA